MFENINSDPKSVLKPWTDVAFVFSPLSFLGLHLQMFWKTSESRNWLFNQDT